MRHTGVLAAGEVGPKPVTHVSFMLYWRSISASFL